MNDLKLHIYSSGTTKIEDPLFELSDASGLWYETGYPGGRYLAGGCFIPREPSDWWEIDGPLRVVVRDGQMIVYEGVIPDLQHQMSASSMGIQLNFVGHWAWLMMNRRMRKRWADDRVDERTWEWQSDTSSYKAADKCTIQRDSRLYFLPKAEEWGDDEDAAVIYTMPTDSIERITFDYDLTGVAGEDWTAILYDVDNTSSEWSVNQAGGGSSSGSVDLDSTNDFSSTTKFKLSLQNTQGGAITPASDGSTFLKITSMVVYGEDETANDINLDSVAADIIGDFSAVLNSDTSYLDASDNIRKVEPFITAGDGYESIGDILVRLADFGDSNDARYAVGLLHSEKAATPDGKPVLFTEEVPDVTAGHDYFLSLDSEMIAGNVNITRDYSAVVNEVTVAYRDEQGWQQIVTDADDAGLSDSTSQTDYGQRDAALFIGNSIAADAYNYGTRFIQRYKDPQWVVSGSIAVFWEIMGSEGELIQASRVEAGKRLKIDGYDTFVISRTRFDDESKTVEITVGVPDDLIHQETVWAPTWNDPVPGSGDDIGADGVPGSGLGIAGLTGTEKWKKKWNKEGKGEKWQHYKKFLQKYRREGKGNFKGGKKAYERKYGKLGN